MSQRESRKTPRQRLKVPIRINGRNPQGQEFSEETSTLVVNWNGALVTPIKPLTSDQTVYVVNQQNGKEAEFRVVGLGESQALSAEGWGIECLNPEKDFWDLLETVGPADPSRYDA
ncbi:MAG: hypothetical protein ACE145_04105 [Terriglobia bacterium]